MRFLTFILALALVLLSPQSIFATSADDVKDKAGETVSAAGEYTKEKKAAFIKEMDDNLATLNAKIKDLNAKAGNSKDQSVTKLESEKKSLEHKLDALKKSSGKAWADMKDGLSKAWMDIKSSLDEAK